MIKALHDPILDEALSFTSFFNGRLLSGEDLSRDQQAHREARRRMGQAIGDGIAFGFEVFEAPALSTRTSPVVTIQPGVAVSRSGQVLALRNGADIRLVRGVSSGAGAAAGDTTFSVCGEPQPGVYVVGEGVYVLTVSPAAGHQGRAPVSGLGNVAASCNVQSVVEGVQFRLVQPNVAQELLLDPLRLRNRIAAVAFGLPDRTAARADPMGPAPSVGYGIVDALRAARALTDCDVPLGLIHWTASAGIRFVDMWSVRRRVTRRSGEPRWGWLTGDRTASEAEALFLQFQEQIDDLAASGEDVSTIAATDRFEFLPPLGFLPLMIGTRPGFDALRFFGANVISRDVAYLEAETLRPLLQESYVHDAIDLSLGERIQVYLVFENVQAVDAGLPVTPLLVFASPTLPYRGVARYGFGRYGQSRFARRVI
jgi:hypothetical protein